MSEKRSGPLFGIGGVTLLTVLLVLCLTLFAVLALSSAQADLRLSEKNARAVAAYYAAENKAYAVMQAAETMWPSGSSRPVAFVFDPALSAECGLDAEAAGSGLRITANIPVQDGSFLRVALSLGPGSGVSRWEVRTWQLMPPAQDEADIAYLPLYVPPQNDVLD